MVNHGWSYWNGTSMTKWTGMETSRYTWNDQPRAAKRATSLEI
jgi:hypothetical protein